MMREGEAVEVRKIWAYRWPQPESAWFKGYEFVREADRGLVLVRQTAGVFAGLESLYPASDVRTATKDNPKICTPCGVVDAGWGENPTTNSTLLWVGAAAALGLVAWLATRKKQVSWTCKAGHECMKFEDGTWHDTDLVTKALKIYSTPPDNFGALTLDYKNSGNETYVLSKPAVMQGIVNVYGPLS